MKVELTKGFYALVDDEDFERISSNKWHYHSKGYACRDSSREESRRKIMMHREILGVESNKVVDHINGNKLDNRRENLRIATVSQNAVNTLKKKQGTTSKYKGVSYFPQGKRTSRWVAQIHSRGKRIYKGYFRTEEDAARAYNRASLEAHGEFAVLNDI